MILELGGALFELLREHMDLAIFQVDWSSLKRTQRLLLELSFGPQTHALSSSRLQERIEAIKYNTLGPWIHSGLFGCRELSHKSEPGAKVDGIFATTAGGRRQNIGQNRTFRVCVCNNLFCCVKICISCTWCTSIHLFDYFWFIPEILHMHMYIYVYMYTCNMYVFMW